MFLLVSSKGNGFFKAEKQLRKRNCKRRRWPAAHVPPRDIFAGNAGKCQSGSHTLKKVWFFLSEILTAGIEWVQILQAKPTNNGFKPKNKQNFGGQMKLWSTNCRTKHKKQWRYLDKIGISTVVQLYFYIK